MFSALVVSPYTTADTATGRLHPRELVLGRLGAAVPGLAHCRHGTAIGARRRQRRRRPSAGGLRQLPDALERGPPAGALALALRHRFAHAGRYELEGGLPTLFASYHPSPRNTNTGRLSAEALDAVLGSIRRVLDGG